MQTLACTTEYAKAIAELHFRTGIYTRDDIAADVVARLRWPYRGTLVDPSCGDGAFLLAAIARLPVEPYVDRPEELAQRVQGWEIYPPAAQAARTRVADVLVQLGWHSACAQDAAVRIVHVGDFLTSVPPEHPYDAIAGNPPYIRWPAIPALLRETYRAALPSFALADLLHAFLSRCANHVAADGEIAIISADRWLFAASAAALRSDLSDRALTLAHIERLDAGSAFHRPKARRRGTPARVHPVLVHLDRSGGGRRLSRAPFYPDAPDAPANNGPTLGSRAHVRLAPWLGPDGIFVVDAETAAQLPRAHLVPAVDTDDVQNQTLTTPKRFAIRTTPTAPPCAAIAAHLERELPRMPPRGRRPKTPWLPPESWHRWDLSRPALLIPRIARSLRPIRMPAGVLAVNHNLSVIAAGDENLDAIEDLLNSRAADEWIRARAAPLEGGFRSITTTLLRALPWHLS